MIERAAAWLLSVQNADGGWGESCHSYVDEIVCRHRAQHAVADGWAVNALQIAGLGRNTRPSSAVLRYLVRTPASATAPGTSPSAPAPAFRATFTSTTTSTAISFR